MPSAVAVRADAVRPAPAPRPFLKWAGGKAQLLPALLKRVPTDIDTYYEPFIGGGALFFALMADPARRPHHAVLNDLNRDLVTAYEVVRDRAGDLACALEPLAARYLAADADGRHSQFYAIRDERPSDPVAIAARLVFLNKTCFNGLYRVNRKGDFNVPHGRHRSPNILDMDTLTAASAALANVELRCSDFQEACFDAGPGDFVYFDPPFHPLSATSNFTSYTEQDFGVREQVKLKTLVDRLTTRNVAVMLSDSPHPWIVKLYRDGGYEMGAHEMAFIPAARSINANGDGRGHIAELLIRNDVLPSIPPGETP